MSIPKLAGFYSLLAVSVFAQVQSPQIVASYADLAARTPTSRIMVMGATNGSIVFAYFADASDATNASASQPIIKPNGFNGRWFGMKIGSGGGGGSGDLLAANNLSEVASPSSALSNLGGVRTNWVELNMGSFGVDATGATDITSTFNAVKASLLAQYPMGGRIRFPKGTYKGNLNIDGRISIVGDSMRSTIFIPADTNLAVIRIDSANVSTNKDFSTLSDFGINCQTNGNYGIIAGTNAYAGNSRNTFERIRITDFATYGIWYRDATACSMAHVDVEDGGPSALGLYVDNERNVQECDLIHCIFRQCKWGVYLQSGNRWKFVSCTIESNDQGGLYIDRTISSGPAYMDFDTCWLEGNGHTPTVVDKTQAQVYFDGNAAYGRTNALTVVFRNSTISAGTSGSLATAYDVSADRAQNVLFDRCSLSKLTDGGFTATRLRFSTGTQGAVYVLFRQCGELNQMPTPTLYASWPALSSSSASSSSTLASYGLFYEYYYEGRLYSNRVPYGIAGSPLNTLTPAYYGEVVKDTSNNRLYFARGLTSSDWVGYIRTGASSELADGLTDETGYVGGGVAVFSNGPTIANPNITGELQLPYSTSTPGLNEVGEIAAWQNKYAASRGAVVHFDGTAETLLLGAIASDTPVNFEWPVFLTGGVIAWTNVLNAASATVNDDAYAAGWNGSTNVPTKNAVYDKIESLVLGGGTVDDTAYDATTWNGVTTIAPSKNAVRDEIEIILAAITAAVSDTAYNAGTWDADTTHAPSKNAVRDQMELKANLVSPSFTTPSLGVATATSVNGTTIPSSKTLVVTTDTLAVHAATTSAQLLGVLSDETGSATGTPLAVFNQSPVIVTPTIASFANANHTHQDSAGGGTLTYAALPTRTLTAGVGISGGGDLGADRTFTLDLTELSANQTIFDSASASRTITFGLSGATDPVLTIGNNSFDLTTGVLKYAGNTVATVGGDIGAATATTPSAGDNTTRVATMAAVQTEIDATQSGTHASPSTTNPLTPTWSGPLHTVWYGATGTINLPAASTYTGRAILIYNTGAFTVTIDPNGSEVVVRDGTVQTGGVNFTLSSGAGNYVALFCDGARWVTLGFKGSLSVGS